METQESEIKSIISTLQNNFSSHDFIEKFSKKYESEYIDMLVSYKGREAFRSVHAQIAKHLSIHMDKYGIIKSGKDSSENVFGDLAVIQWWDKF